MKLPLKMLTLMVLMLCRIVSGVSVYGCSDIEKGEQFDLSVARAVRNILNPGRLEELERTLKTLNRKVEEQDNRIIDLESIHLKQNTVIERIQQELNTYRKYFGSIKSNTRTGSIAGRQSLSNDSFTDIRSEENRWNGSTETQANEQKQPVTERKQRRAIKPHHRAERLSRRGVEESVAFSAYLGHSIKRLSPGYTVTCSNVILNNGNSYNAKTGVFTAPYDGVYMFDYHFDSSKHTVLALFVDGVNQLDAVTFPAAQQEGMGGNFILVDLRTGQQVWLEGRIIADGIVIGDDSFRYTTFSGVLLY